MKTEVWLSCHDGAAQKGKVPPCRKGATFQMAEKFFCPSVFNAVPRYLGDKFVHNQLSPLLKGWKSLTRFFISSHFLWFLYLSGCLSGAVLMGCALRFITEEVVSKIDGSYIPLSR